MSEARVDFRLYSGDGQTLRSRGRALPPWNGCNSDLDHPQHYLADKPLRDAVNVAIALGQPLLVSGEPGTGKTQLASSIAWELGLPAPLVFHTKTTSTARDLFYHYDSLRHFHDAQLRREQLSPDHYVEYQALGLAILLTLAPDSSSSYLPESYRGSGPTRSVVLVDEIDKAPRDLPNDILNEIEKMSFRVREAGHIFSADPAHRPILILTSNSEKSLPDAFLRRCVFFHIAFPTRERLREIVQRRLGPDSAFTPAMLEGALRHFDKIRSLPLNKKPATAECIAWMNVVGKLGIDVDNPKPGDVEALAFTYSILAKTKEDLAALTGRATAIRP